MFKCWICSFLATCYLNSNESLLYRVYNITNRVPCVEIQLETWLKLLSVGGGWTWMCPMVADAWDQHTLQYTWPLVTMQACFHDRIKKLKPYLWPFISQFGLCETKKQTNIKICTVQHTFSLTSYNNFSSFSLIMWSSASTKPIKRCIFNSMVLM